MNLEDMKDISKKNMEETIQFLGYLVEESGEKNREFQREHALSLAKILGKNTPEWCYPPDRLQWRYWEFLTGHKIKDEE